MANIEALDWIKAAVTDIGTRQILIEQAVARIEERLSSSPDKKPADDVRYVANRDQMTRILAKILMDDDGPESKKP
jgi:hypothetical protein